MAGRTVDSMSLTKGCEWTVDRAGEGRKDKQTQAASAGPGRLQQLAKNKHSLSQSQALSL